jgi:hypothetical protein
VKFYVSQICLLILYEVFYIRIVINIAQVLKFNSIRHNFYHGKLFRN